MFPRLGVLHFTLAMVFVPFGAPQARTVTAPRRSAAATVTASDSVAATPAAMLARFASFGRGSRAVDARAR